MKIFGTEIKIFPPPEEVKEERDERRREREAERKQKRGQRELERKLKQREQERAKIEEEVALAAGDETLPEAQDVAERAEAPAIAEPEAKPAVVEEVVADAISPKPAPPKSDVDLKPAVALQNSVARFTDKPPAKKPAKPVAPTPKPPTPKAAAPAPVTPTPPTPSETELAMAVKEGEGIYTRASLLIQGKNFGTYPYVIDHIMASIARIQKVNPQHTLLGPLYNLAGGLGLGYVASQPNLNKTEQKDILLKSVTRMFSALRHTCQHAKLLNDFGGGLMQNLMRFGVAIVKLVPDIPASWLTAKQWWLLGSRVFERYQGEGRGKIAQALYAKSVEAKGLGSAPHASL